MTRGKSESLNRDGKRPNETHNQSLQGTPEIPSQTKTPLQVRCLLASVAGEKGRVEMRKSTQTQLWKTVPEAAGRTVESGGGMNHREIAERLGLTYQRVQQIERQAILKLMVGMGVLRVEKDPANGRSGRKRHRYVKQDTREGFQWRKEFQHWLKVRVNSERTWPKPVMTFGEGY